MLDYGCDVQGGDRYAARPAHEGVYQLEDGVPADIVEGLKKLGHQTTSVVGPLGGGRGDLDRLGQGHAHGWFRSTQDGCALGY
jgi:gamma-glutamyltranspeptidase/glutathione hydrolase